MFATGCIFSSQGPESGGVFPDRIRDGERQEMSGGRRCVWGAGPTCHLNLGVIKKYRKYKMWITSIGRKT